MNEEDFSGALSVSFQLTEHFLRRHRRYRELLSLTPDNFRFDNVLWHSSIAALRGMLQVVAEEEGLTLGEGDLDEAVRNLVEGIVLRSRIWD